MVQLKGFWNLASDWFNLMMITLRKNFERNIRHREFIILKTSIAGTEKRKFVWNYEVPDTINGFLDAYNYLNVEYQLVGFRVKAHCKATSKGVLGWASWEKVLLSKPLLLFSLIFPLLFVYTDTFQRPVGIHNNQSVRSKCIYLSTYYMKHMGWLFQLLIVLLNKQI